jgi:FtsH-binding integral membrane protein
MVLCYTHTMAWIAGNNDRVNVGGGFGGAAGALPEAVAQRFLARVYQLMAFGLAVTGIVAAIIASSPSLLQFFLTNPGVLFAVIIGQFATVMALSWLQSRIGEGLMAALFFAYAALTGVTFSLIFLVYTKASIAGTFFVTAGSFAGLAIYGTLTKRSLDSLGSFGFMGLVGLILASIVNFWLRSPMMYWLTSFGGVIVFTALTAYDAAKLRQIAAQADVRTEAARKLALRGALALYLDFINLFLYLLRFLGNRRRD